MKMPATVTLCFRSERRARYTRRPVCAALLAFERRAACQRAVGIGRPDLANRWSVRTWRCLGYGRLIENIMEKDRNGVRSKQLMRSLYFNGSARNNAGCQAF